MKPLQEIHTNCANGSAREGGFTLIEMVVALVILFIAVVGVFGALTYATRFNRGNSQRSQALAVLQKEVELLRSAKFTTAITSNTTVHMHTTPTCPYADDGGRDIRGGTYEAEYRCGSDRTVYEVRTTIDDDPSTPNVVDVNANTGMKQIEILVTPQGADGQWVTGNAVRAVFRRVRAN